MVTSHPVGVTNSTQNSKHGRVRPGLRGVMYSVTVLYCALCTELKLKCIDGRTKILSLQKRKEHHELKVSNVVYKLKNDKSPRL